MSVGEIMILGQRRTDHKGKVIASIKADNNGNDLIMCQEITFNFTDGTNIILKPDWRGPECYISQRTNQ